jgi:hypothetical protein
MRTGCANARTLIVYIYIAIEATRNGTTTRLLSLSSIRSFGQRSRSRVSSTQSAPPLPRLNVFDDPRFSTSYSFVSMLLLASVPRPRTWSCRKRSTMGHRVRTRRIAAGAREPLAQAIADAKKMFGLAAEARVISCYEAGREGFWLHRYLTGRGDTNYVVDSASIEVDRRARRTKTDAVESARVIGAAGAVCGRRSALLAGGAGPKCGG